MTKKTLCLHNNEVVVPIIGDKYLFKVVERHFDESFSKIDFEGYHWISEARLIARSKHSDRDAIEEIAMWLCGETKDLDKKDSICRFLAEDIQPFFCEMIVNSLSSKVTGQGFDYIFERLELLLKKIGSASGKTIAMSDWSVKAVGF